MIFVLLSIEFADDFYMRRKIPLGFPLGWFPVKFMYIDTFLYI